MPGARPAREGPGFSRWHGQDAPAAKTMAVCGWIFTTADGVIPTLCCGAARLLGCSRGPNVCAYCSTDSYFSTEVATMNCNDLGPLVSPTLPKAPIRAGSRNYSDAISALRCWKTAPPQPPSTGRGQAATVSGAPRPTGTWAALRMPATTSCLEHGGRRHQEHDRRHHQPAGLQFDHDLGERLHAGTASAPKIVLAGASTSARTWAPRPSHPTFSCSRRRAPCSRPSRSIAART